MSGYDYSLRGAYFVTLCSCGGESLFGSIRVGLVVLSAEGEIAADGWARVPEHSPGAELDEFVVMPNHVHGIVLLGGVGGGTACCASEPNVSAPEGTGCCAPTVLQSLRRFGEALPGSLPTIVRSYKSAVTRAIRLASGRHAQVWQRGYYEHVIRDEEDHAEVVQYILGNPAEEQRRRDDEQALCRSRNSPLARPWLRAGHP